MKHLIAFSLLALSACVTTTGAPSQPGEFPTGSEDTCDGAQYAGLIGRDGTALEKVLILRQVRILRPGMMVTQEFRADRLNFRIGTDGNIVSITCG